MSVTINYLPPEILLHIFASIEDPKDLSACVSVSQRWKALACDDSLWLRQLKSHLINAPRPPSQHLNLKDRERDRFTEFQPSEHTNGNLHQIMISWRREFGSYANLYPLIKSKMQKLFQYLADSSSATLQSFNPGVFDFAMLRRDFEVQKRVGLELGEDVQALVLAYHWIDGQKARIPYVDAGLFGAYTCYGQLSSLFMLPSRYVKQTTVRGFRMLIFAVCPRSGRHLGVVLNEGQYNGLVVQVSDSYGSYISHGPFKQWFAQYCEDVASGQVYDLVPTTPLVEAIEPQPPVTNTAVISAFANVGPYTSVAVTRGIEVHVATILQMEQNINQWAYRIKICYVGEELQYGFRQAQLLERRWSITYQNGNTEEVRGDGVVGFFPIVGFGLPFFHYCSICQCQQDNDVDMVLSQAASEVVDTQHNEERNVAESGVVEDEANEIAEMNIDMPINQSFPVWMEGEYTFVPGSRAAPTGPPFLVQVARFTFQHPLRNPFGE